MTDGALRLLSYLCDNVKEGKYGVFDREDLAAAAGGESERTAAMTELVFGGYAEKKYDDGSSVCCTVTVKGRAFNAELKALSLRSDDAATVVKADAVGRPVVVFDNKDAGFRKQIRKIAGSSKSALVFGLIGGIVGGVIGGVIVALIMHFALA